MGDLFGTDGIRGIAIKELTCDMIMKIGSASAMVLTENKEGRSRILIGKDTRISSDVIESALVAGICQAGVDVCILGVMTTQAVSMLTEKYNADAGIMITASHNDMEYNGLKMFSSNGMRISGKSEKEIEKLVNGDDKELVKKSGAEIGRIYYEENAQWDYMRSVMKIAECDLKGIKVAVDCGNGSAARFAKHVFEGLGASCIFIGCEPDGMNINKNCGTADVSELRKNVLDRKCHVGIAFDGDADRCLIIDENGEVLNGDKMLAIFSKFMKVQGLLKNKTIVTTVMSNRGLQVFANKEGITLSNAAVGSKNVLDKMLKIGCNLGGESCGHIIFLDHEKIGDGIITGIKFLEVMKKTRCMASQLSECLEVFPQVETYVEIPSYMSGIWAENEDLIQLITNCKKKLGLDGRIIVRESGTEHAVRIMVEGRNTGLITEYAKNIADMLNKVIYEDNSYIKKLLS